MSTKNISRVWEEAHRLSHSQTLIMLILADNTADERGNGKLPLDRITKTLNIESRQLYLELQELHRNNTIRIDDLSFQIFPSEQQWIKIPPVLSPYQRARKAADIHLRNKSARDRIFNRDGWKCRECGSEENLTIDHIISVKVGGSNKDSNLQALCKSCNSRKGAR